MITSKEKQTLLVLLQRMLEPEPKLQTSITPHSCNDKVELKRAIIQSELQRIICWEILVDYLRERGMDSACFSKLNGDNSSILQEVIYFLDNNLIYPE